ncbi:hypothetical protein D3C72_1608750 [compost metagenome]
MALAWRTAPVLDELSGSHHCLDRDSWPDRRGEQLPRKHGGDQRTDGASVYKLQRRRWPGSRIAASRHPDHAAGVRIHRQTAPFSRAHARRAARGDILHGLLAVERPRGDCRMALDLHFRTGFLYYTGAAWLPQTNHDGPAHHPASAGNARLGPGSCTSRRYIAGNAHHLLAL